MLVLTRRVGEEIIIDGVVSVIVLSVQGQKVRLGVIAPKSIRVDRAEISVRRGELEGAALDAAQPAS